MYCRDSTREKVGSYGHVRDSTKTCKPIKSSSWCTNYYSEDGVQKLIGDVKKWDCVGSKVESASQLWVRLLLKVPRLQGRDCVSGSRTPRMSFHGLFPALQGAVLPGSPAGKRPHYASYPLSIRTLALYQKFGHPKISGAFWQLFWKRVPSHFHLHLPSRPRIHPS